MTNEKQQTDSRSKQKAGKNNKKTIIIVDDEEDIALTYEHFLSSVGYEVKHSSTPVQLCVNMYPIPFSMIC
jgi:DNA-binding NtrC family response regulator